MTRFLLPHDSWDSDLLLRVHLNSLPPPSHPIDRVASLARLQKLKQDLETLEVAALSPAQNNDSNSKEITILKFKIKVLSWALFPIDRLPLEIVRFIFQLVIRDVPLYATYNRYRLVLTWVCRPWRRVALNASNFWSSIWVGDDDPYTCSLEFLRRAGSAPLDIRIGDKERQAFEIEDAEPMSLNELKPIMDALVKKLPTIRSFLGVFIQWDVALDVIHKFNESKLEASSLEGFTMHHLGHTYVFSTFAPLPPEILNSIKLFNGHAPKLACLGINGLVVDWTPEILANLTSLDLRRIPRRVAQGTADIRRILQECHHLYRLALCYLVPYHDEMPSSGPPLQIPTLRELTLDDLSPNYIMCLLSQIEAPNVMYLEVRRLTSMAHDIRPTFSGLAGRFPKTKMLVLNDIVTDNSHDMEPCMTKFYESMPHLEILRISLITDAAIRPLYAGPTTVTVQQGPPPAQVNELLEGALGPTILCPRLRLLHFGWVDIQVVKDLVRGRHQRGHPFHNAYAFLSTADYPTPDDLREIEEVVDNLYKDYWLCMPEEWALYEEMSHHLDSSSRLMLYTNTPGFSPRR